MVKAAEAHGNVPALATGHGGLEGGHAHRAKLRVVQRQGIVPTPHFVQGARR